MIGGLVNSENLINELVSNLLIFEQKNFWCFVDSLYLKIQSFNDVIKFSMSSDVLNSLKIRFIKKHKMSNTRTI